MYSAVLLTLDGSPLGEMAIPHAVAIAKSFDIPIILLRAIPIAPLQPDMMATGMAPAVLPPNTELLDTEESIAKAYLRSHAESLRNQGLTVTEKTPIGDASIEVSAEQVRHPGCLTVMATHARQGLGRLVFGSVADTVLHSAKGPLLLIRGYD